MAQNSFDPVAEEELVQTTYEALLCRYMLTGNAELVEDVLHAINALSRFDYESAQLRQTKYPCFLANLAICSKDNRVKTQSRSLINRWVSEMDIFNDEPKLGSDSLTQTLKPENDLPPGLFQERWTNDKPSQTKAAGGTDLPSGLFQELTKKIN